MIYNAESSLQAVNGITMRDTRRYAALHCPACSGFDVPVHAPKSLHDTTLASEMTMLLLCTE